MFTNVKKRALAGLGVAALAGSLGMAGVTAAGASTTGCADDAGVNCGTFGNPTFQGVHHPAFADVKSAVAAVNQPIIGYNDVQGDSGSDLVQVQHQGIIPNADVSGTSYSFKFAPFGVESNLCISNPNTPTENGQFSTLLVLRTCNGGEWQRFVAVSLGHASDRYRDRSPELLSTTNPFVLVSVANDLLVQTSGAAPTPAPATETRQMDASGNPRTTVQSQLGNMVFKWKSPIAG